MPDTCRARKIGVFGGSFDPIHAGHLHAAQDVRTALGLERVLLVPAGRQPLKAGHARAEHRLAMIRLAVEGMAGLDVSDVEIRRSGKSYTVDTVRELAREPGRERGDGSGPRIELHLLIGTDAVHELPNWRDVEGIFRRAKPAVLDRPGGGPVDWEELARRLPEGLVRDLRGSVVRLERPVDISSTEIRRRLASGESIAGLVPPAVGEYIREHGLYSGGGA